MNNTALSTTFALLLITVSVRADYLEVRRGSSVKDRPATGATPLLRVEPGEILPLVKLDQENKHYKVRLPGSSQTGFFHRNFGRGFRGDPPAFTTNDLQKFRERHLGVGAPQIYFERVREGYVVGYDSRLKIPVWIQYELSQADVTRTASNAHVKRKDDFRSDISMPKHTWATNKDYKEKSAPGGKVFAKGHMAPAADMIRSERVMSESFFLTNMVPQVGDDFNGSVWEDLERESRKWIKANGPTTIIVGPVFKPQGTVGNRSVNYKVIGDNTVAVPTHLFKIIVDNRDPQIPKALAFLMKNRVYGPTETYADRLVSIDVIEQMTGLDFLSSLDDSLEMDLESDAAGKIWWLDP